MVGESVAGVVVSLMRICTKSGYGDSPDGVQSATYLFLGLSIGFIACCAITNEFVYRSKFRRYCFEKFEHMKTLSSTAARNAHAYLEQHHQDHDESGVIDSNICDDGIASEHIIVGAENMTAAIGQVARDDDVSAWQGPQVSKIRLAKILKSPMFCVFFSFVVTLSVFPGVACMAPSDRLGDWMPIVTITMFNVGDLIGNLSKQT